MLGTTDLGDEKALNKTNAQELAYPPHVRSGMFIVHIALQGCVRPNPVPYGITPDTGGHIRYVLELIAENERAGVARQDLVVRRFDDAELGSAYATREDKLSDASRIVRIDGASTKYLAKEDIWREHVALCTAFEAYIEALPQKPDIIHAHYADAGVLAAHAKKKFGIPMVFTGHSLGRVKAQTLRAADVTPSLETRIATEDAVIATADRIIASSRDEAEVQYGLYPAARAERIRVNPPGCDLSRFSATSGTTFPAPLLRQINRFLDYPDLPPVLAIARPVRRKNLSGLVRAFGEDDGLQARANLVIFAGNRHDIRDLSEENQHVIEELLYLVDRYDLYGKVALPKMHADDDVPWLYRYAAHLGGVFANTAFNEPFGLTFLEAAASGVPVVATRSGGPTDIVGQLENGTLVDPVSPQATADALHRVLEDPELWQQQADNGLNRLDRFSWQRHAATYLSDMRRLKKPRPRPAQLAISLPGLLVSDIDNTLTGDRPALRTFAELLQRQGRMTYAIATGRSLHDAINVLQDWNAPVPKVLITSVGSEIYFGSGIDYDDLANDEVWA
ncbi:MAG: glycosyltransferase, partial [Pseudomonadota bacterium]